MFFFLTDFLSWRWSLSSRAQNKANAETSAQQSEPRGVARGASASSVNQAYGTVISLPNEKNRENERRKAAGGGRWRPVFFFNMWAIWEQPRVKKMKRKEKRTLFTFTFSGKFALQCVHTTCGTGILFVFFIIFLSRYYFRNTTGTLTSRCTCNDGVCVWVTFVLCFCCFFFFFILPSCLKCNDWLAFFVSVNLLLKCFRWWLKFFSFWKKKILYLHLLFT